MTGGMGCSISNMIRHLKKFRLMQCQISTSHVVSKKSISSPTAAAAVDDIVEDISLSASDHENLMTAVLYQYRLRSHSLKTNHPSEEKKSNVKKSNALIIQSLYHWYSSGIVNE